VKMGTTANQKKLFFNLRKAKSKISALEEGDLRPDQVKLIAKRLGVTEQDVVDMNRRLGGDVSLNAPIRDDGDSGEWQDWLVDEVSDQETRLVEDEESDNRKKALGEALSVLNERERRIFEARRLADDPITLEDLAGRATHRNLRHIREDLHQCRQRNRNDCRSETQTLSRRWR
jgi:RNA polymerase sigma-32 factor